MRQIKNRLYGIYLLIVAVFILLLYFLLTNVIEDRIVETQKTSLEDEMTALVEYVDETIRSEGTEETDIIRILKTVSPVIHERITFMDTKGTPLFDSEVPIMDLGNQAGQPEIQQILFGQDRGVSITGNGSNQENYTVAQHIYGQSEEPLGILRLSNGITNLTAVIQEVLRILLIGVLLLAVVLILLTSSWMDRMNRAMKDMKRVMARLMNADYEAKYTTQSFDEIDELGSSINELAVSLKEQRQHLKASEERTLGLINHLIIGVMLLDESRQIRMVNPTMNELLGANLYGKISDVYSDSIQSAELIELIEEAYATEETRNAEIRLYLPEEKTLDANVVPVPGSVEGELDFIVLLYDITEIQRLENIRTDFATNVSHELRTPITALKGFSETLLDGAMHDQEVLTEFLEIMLKESTRLDTMVQDILQLSRLERSQGQAPVEWIPVHEVVEEVFQILQQKVELKNITCYLEENESLSIQTNRDQLKQVLMNLIANAVSYTPENGTVIIDINKVGNEAKIQIVDNGIGIPEENQARIFERFYRVDKARSRNSGGTGLGLSIVKWLVDNMKGRIELYSEVDVGTTFVLWLPLQRKTGDQLAENV